MTVSVELHPRLRTDGRQLIQIKVNEREKRYRISSEIYVKKVQFNKKAKWGKWIKDSHPESKDLNRRLEKKIQDVKDYRETHGVINPVAAIKGDNFFEFADDFIKKYNHEDSLGTYESYKSKLNKLREYAGESLTFNDINTMFIRNYVNHLVSQGNRVNTYATDLRRIRAIINQAVKDDIIEFAKNPFLKTKIKTEKTKKIPLTKEELDLIRNAKLIKGHYTWHARNIFLFCINCMGMRIGDAMRIKWSDIHGDRIIYKMHKVKDPVVIKMTAEVKKILSYYDGEHYVFPYIEEGGSEFMAIKKKTALVNKGLKAIADLVEIKKKVSTHIGRHTFTRLAINVGANPRTIQKALRHQSFDTTEGYINDLDNSDVNDLNDSIFE